MYVAPSAPNDTVPTKHATVNILFIEGFSIVADLMTERLIGKTNESSTNSESHNSRSCWTFATITRAQCFSTDADLDIPDMDAISRCRDQLASGTFHAAVVVDLSSYHDLFCKELGPSLSAFTHAGGAVSFTTSEGLITCATLNDIFGTAWKGSSYYRTSWGVAVENTGYVRHVFGKDVCSFSAKACSLRNVPPHERCWGVTSTSVTQSIAPCLAGKDVSKAHTDDNQWAENDYDVFVAMHHHGAGWMMFTGDVNIDSETVTIVSNFIKSRTPSHPVCALASHHELSKLSNEEFAAAKDAKIAGNSLFSAKKYLEALGKYDAALIIFGSRAGDTHQIGEKVKVLSNKSECHLMQSKWRDAENMASAALTLDPEHAKSLLRRAKARIKMAEEPDFYWRGFMLENAKEDIEKLHSSSRISTASKELLKKIKDHGIRDTPKTHREDEDDKDHDSDGVKSDHDSRPLYFSTGSINGNGNDLLQAPLSSLCEPTPTAWAEGLPDVQRYEWLTDCYRMRVDDDCKWGGGNMHGLYKQDGTITKDFLIFCRLAQHHGVIPDQWDWTSFLGIAKNLLPFDFEKSDAQDKYGRENYFSAMMGRRSLRYTGTVVYGSGVEITPVPTRVQKVIDEVMKCRSFSGELCSDVGRAQIWTSLMVYMEEEW